MHDTSKPHKHSNKKLEKGNETKDTKSEKEK